MADIKRCQHGTVVESKVMKVVGKGQLQDHTYVWNCGKCNPSPKPQPKYEQLRLF